MHKMFKEAANDRGNTEDLDNCFPLNIFFMYRLFKL